MPINKVNKSYLEKFERIIIGASIRYGKHKDELYNFILNHLDVISNKDNAFFSVNVVARKPGKNTPKTNPLLQHVKHTYWKTTSTKKQTLLHPIILTTKKMKQKIIIKRLKIEMKNQ